MLTLNIAGLFVGLGRLFIWVPEETGTVLLNLIWTVYNLIMLGASLSVANEARQVRAAHRVQMKLHAGLRFKSGRTVRCVTSDYSEGGVGVQLPTEMPADPRMLFLLQQLVWQSDRNRRPGKRF